jgi:NitT/TauT family transport system ATP-binding protein
MADPVISFRQVSRVFRAQRGDVVALSDLNLDIYEGEFVTVVGPSGCGKSTALNTIVGLLEPSTGEVLFRGRPTAGICHEVGYVTQADNLFPWRTVLENVTFGPTIQRSSCSTSRSVRWTRRRDSSSRTCCSSCGASAGRPR